MPFPLLANLAPKNSLVNRRCGICGQGSLGYTIRPCCCGFCGWLVLCSCKTVGWCSIGLRKEKKTFWLKSNGATCERQGFFISGFQVSNLICLASQRTETSGLPVATANLLNIVSTLFHQTLGRRFVDCTLGATKARSNR